MKNNKPSFFKSETWEAIRFFLILFLAIYALSSCSERQASKKAEAEHQKTQSIISQTEHACYYSLENYLTDEGYYANIVEDYICGESDISEDDALDALNTLRYALEGVSEEASRMYSGEISVDLYD